MSNLGDVLELAEIFFRNQIKPGSDQIVQRYGRQGPVAQPIEGQTHNVPYDDTSANKIQFVKVQSERSELLNWTIYVKPDFNHPNAVNIASPPTLILEYGIGGARYVFEKDIQATGEVLHVSAQTVEISVIKRSGSTPILTPQPFLPVTIAAAADSRPSEISECSSIDLPPGVPVTTPINAFWRTYKINLAAALTGADTLTIDQLDNTGGVVFTETMIAPQQEIQRCFVSDATQIRFTGAAAGPIPFQVELKGLL